MSVTSWTMGFPAIPFPQHGAGKKAPQSFIYPGAVQPPSNPTKVLSVFNGFPALPFPNHKSGTGKPQSRTFPGAVKPATPFLTLRDSATVNLTVKLTVHEP